jgi:hypothetical protein
MSKLRFKIWGESDGQEQDDSTGPAICRKDRKFTRGLCVPL